MQVKGSYISKTEIYRATQYFISNTQHLCTNSASFYQTLICIVAHCCHTTTQICATMVRYCSSCTFKHMNIPFVTFICSPILVFHFEEYWKASFISNSQKAVKKKRWQKLSHASFRWSEEAIKTLVILMSWDWHFLTVLVQYVVHVANYWYYKLLQVIFIPTSLIETAANFSPGLLSCTCFNLTEHI